MAARLPVVGGDDNDWGKILNDFLDVAHNADGTLQNSAVQAAGALTTNQSGKANGVASLDSAGQVPAAQLGSGTASSSNFLRGDGTWAVPAAGSATLAGSSDVTISSPSTGQILAYNSTAGKWQNENDVTVNVKNYGAKGDGSTDDTGAITSALAAVTPSSVTGQSGTVYFPAGTYITTGIVLPERVAIEGVGMGTTIKLKASSGALANLIANQQNYSGTDDAQAVCIRNMRLDGNKGNQPAGNWNCGIVLTNTSPSGSYEYNDGRHQVHNVMIQYFTGDGFVQTGNGVVQASDIQVWACNGFGFNLNEDSYYINCDAGGNGLDGFLIQGGSNRLSSCKSWYSGGALVTGISSGDTATIKTVTPPANAWDGGNISGLTFSLANGFGNGFLWYNISGSSTVGNYSGGTYTSVGTQDNARAGFYIIGGRQTLVGAEADSNNNNGTSDGTASGTPTGSYAGFDLNGTNNVVSGISWNRSANLNQQAAALNLSSGASRNRIELGFYGSLNDGSNMAPLTATSSISNNTIEMKSNGSSYLSVAYAATWTPDPFNADTQAMHLTGNVSVGNPALTGTNTTGLFLYPGMHLTLVFSQDGAGGRTITLSSAFKTNGYGFLTAHNAASSITFLYDGTYWQAIGGSNNNFTLLSTAGDNFFTLSQDGDSQARWMLQSSGNIQMGPGTGTRDTNFGRVAAGVVGGAAWSTTGITGATASSRYVGATASGAPASGTFSKGDYVIDQSGTIWICTAAGTPGTWVSTAAGNVTPAAVTAVRSEIPLSGYYLVTANTGSTSTSTFSTLGLVYLTPLQVQATQVFTGLSTGLSTQAVGGTSPLVMMGLYADGGTGTRPTGSLVSGSQVSFDPTAQAVGNVDMAFTAPLTLNAGTYWAAWTVTSGSALTTSPTMVTITVVGNTALDSLMNLSHKAWQASISSSATTLPGTLSSYMGSGGWPIIGLKAQ